jgi:hypothetical protein
LINHPRILILGTNHQKLYIPASIKVREISGRPILKLYFTPPSQVVLGKAMASEVILQHP